MAEPNILLTRIDNRLIHGQVGMTWTNWLGANLVLVADDETAADPVQQNLMEMAIAGNVGARFFTLQKTIDVIHKAASHQKIFLVVRTPQNALALVKGGVPIKNINVGPSLPKFFNEEIINFLVDKFNVRPISGDAQADLKYFLGE